VICVVACISPETGSKGTARRAGECWLVRCVGAYLPAVDEEVRARACVFVCAMSTKSSHLYTRRSHSASLRMYSRVTLRCMCAHDRTSRTCMACRCAACSYALCIVPTSLMHAYTASRGRDVARVARERVDAHARRVRGGACMCCVRAIVLCVRRRRFDKLHVLCAAASSGTTHCPIGQPVLCCAGPC
jgi:hypothetical protein